MMDRKELSRLLPLAILAIIVLVGFIYMVGLGARKSPQIDAYFEYPDELPSAMVVGQSYSLPFTIGSFSSEPVSGQYSVDCGATMLVQSFELEPRSTTTILLKVSPRMPLKSTNTQRESWNESFQLPPGARIHLPENTDFVVRPEVNYTVDELAQPIRIMSSHQINSSGKLTLVQTETTISRDGDSVRVVQARITTELNPEEQDCKITVDAGASSREIYFRYDAEDPGGFSS